jgi:hypothetical protein
MRNESHQLRVAGRPLLSPGQVLIRPDGYIAHIATRDGDHSSANVVRCPAVPWNDTWNEPRRMTGHQRHPAVSEGPGPRLGDL